MVKPSLSMLAALATLTSAARAEPGPSIREMIELTDLSSPAISPDGTMVAFREERASVEENEHELAWHVVPIDGSRPPRRLAGAGEGNWVNGTLLAQPPIWSLDSRWIIYRAVIDGEAQLWRAAADGSRVERLTREAGNVMDVVLAPDGRSLTFSVGAPRHEIVRAEQQEQDEGVLIDASVDPSRPLVRGGRIDGRRATERLRGLWFGNGGLLSELPPRMRSIDLVSGQVRDVTSAEAARLLPQVKPFDRMEGRLIVARSDSSDTRGVAYVLSTGPTRELLVARGQSLTNAVACRAPDCIGRHIVSAEWASEGNRLLFTTTDGSGNDGLYVWDVGSGTVAPLVSGSGALNGGRDQTQGCAVGKATVVCVAAAANVPPHLVAIDLISGQTTELATPNASLAGRTGGKFEALSWTDNSGRRFTGQLMMPEGGSRPVPLFITYYACSGYLRGGLGDEFPLRQLAQNGIAALCINRFPASDGVGDQVQPYRIALSGVEAAVDLLARGGAIDRNHVGMGGVSFGGESTIWVAMRSKLLAAMSIANVLLTPTYYWFNALDGRDVPDMLRKGWGIGDPDTHPSGWRALSPVFNVERIKTPLLLQLPEQEYRPVVELVARLQRAQTPVELWAFPDEVHIKWQPRHQLAANERNLDWFRYWLQGRTDPNPAKQEQYRRWTALRGAEPGRQVAGASPSHPRNQASTSMIGSRR